MHTLAHIYTDFFDKKIENNTIVVVFIAVILILVSYIVSNWIQKNIVLSNNDNIVNINWVNYKVSFEKID